MLKKIFTDKTFENVVLAMFIIITLFLLSMSFVVGQIVIDENSIVVPNSILENTDLTVDFTASNNTDVISYEIYYDNTLISDTNTVSMLMNYSTSGIHTLKLFASDGMSNDSVIKTFNVEDVPMILTLNNPTNNSYTSHVISININISTYADRCLYSINSSSDSPLNGAGQNFYKDIDLGQDGLYNLSINCSNVYDYAITSYIFRVDTLSPVISSKSAIVDTNNVVTFNAVTSAVCNCKYDAIDRSFDSMSFLFANTGGLQHSSIITGLLDGAYTYYVKCKSINNVLSNTESLSFNIITKPSADISLSKSSPIKAGTYGVRLITSVPVSVAPSLYYNFDNDASPRYITLAGSGTTWNGYLIIEENAPNKIGTFHYSATDFNNNVGDLISDGEIFLVDTTKPIAPTSVAKIEESNGDIKLKWYYDGEVVQRYNIYRSTSGDPDYVDYYDSTDSNQYTDSNVVDGVNYYYKIAAVDNANNDGELSGVIQATSNKVFSNNVNTDSQHVGDISTYTPSSPQTLDNGLVPKVTQLASEFSNYLTDIDAVKSELDKINDPNKLKIINILHLAENTKTAQATIKGLIDTTNDLKNQNLKVADLDMQLNKLRMDAIKAKSLVAEDIIVNEESAYNQVTQGSDVDQAISEVVSVNLSRNVLNNYSLTNKQMQDNVVVNTDVLIFKIKYLGKDDYDKFTLVKKVITSSQELNNISIIEIIPKSFEAKASDITFDIDSQQNPTIVKDDPVLRWDSATFSKQTIYYMINNNADMSSAKNTKTILLYTPNFKVTQTIQNESSKTNMLTGLVGLDNISISDVSPMQWLVVIGISMILGLSAYYVALDRKEKKRVSQRLKEHRIITKQKTVLAPISISRNNISHNTATPMASISVIPSSTHSQIINAGIISKNNINTPRFDINLKLDRANAAINSFDYENARLIYNECIQYYPKIIFKNNSEKISVKLMLDHLFQKITVYRLIYSSRKHINTKNYALLRQDIVMISKICNKLYSTLSKIDENSIDAEKKFVDYVSNSKKYLESLSS